MSAAPYTEDILVQQTTADYLEQQLGWESVYAYIMKTSDRTACWSGRPTARGC